MAASGSFNDKCEGRGDRVLVRVTHTFCADYSGLDAKNINWKAKVLTGKALFLNLANRCHVRGRPEKPI